MPMEPPKRTERRRLTHVDRSGRPRMVDVSEKPPTARRAVAEAEVALAQETISLIVDGGGPKGDVLTVAELAGVMGGKRTSDLIPLCHPLPLTDLVVEVKPDRARGALLIRATAATVARTGVEMEALTAAAVAALTVYDMVKGVDRSAEIRHLRVVEKSGGRSGEWRRPAEPAGSPSAKPPRPKGVRGPRRTG
ncbi:MAG: molybdenum cofactor biosynthesis protein C, molybdenum cofactor biosynthesis protein C [Chloroflexi bacterium CSP1-4]|nr:MAG: molybdenum cofactor biosynthesis protein C, molybdenum cofactor biosynthesis protein C [Chloroflexi bacterium CSP1-4]